MHETHEKWRCGNGICLVDSSLVLSFSKLDLRKDILFILHHYSILFNRWKLYILNFVWLRCSFVFNYIHQEDCFVQSLNTFTLGRNWQLSPLPSRQTAWKRWRWIWQRWLNSQWLLFFGGCWTNFLSSDQSLPIISPKLTANFVKLRKFCLVNL